MNIILLLTLLNNKKYTVKGIKTFKITSDGYLATNEEWRADNERNGTHKKIRIDNYERISMEL